MGRQSIRSGSRERSPFGVRVARWVAWASFVLAGVSAGVLVGVLGMAGAVAAEPSSGASGAAGASEGATKSTKRTLLIATTTSVHESGLLHAILPEFTKQSGLRLQIVAVGSGAAIEMGRKGDADVVIAHAPAAEEALVKEGIARTRTSFMENYFVLVGPKEDPAGVAAAATPEEAFGRIGRLRPAFVSRADESGTHTKERALFSAAGLDPEARWPGYHRTGSGMGPSLQVAGEKRAYILSDIGTFLAFRDRIGLVVLSKPAPSLRNVYSVLQLDATRFARPIESEGAAALEAFLLSPEVQRRIGEFGREKFGESLFVPLRPGQGKGTR